MEQGITKQEKSASKTPDVRRRFTRRRILEAARAHFAEKGYEAANVSDIVRGVGMSQGIFYYHFEDKKAALVEILEDFFGKLKELSTQWASSTDTGEDAMRGFSTRLAMLLYDNREAAAIVAREARGSDPKVRAMISGFYDHIYGSTAMALELGISLGSVRRMDTRIASVALVGMMKEVVFYFLEREGDLDTGRVVEELSALQNFGIRPAVAAAGKQVEGERQP